MQMKVILFGATGMVGQGVLRQCLLDPGVESILCIGRHPSGVSDPKLRDLVRADMFDFKLNAGELSSYDSCFFCLGVSSVGMSEVEYTHLTYDLTLGWAHALAAQNPAMRFLYVSGMGTGGKSMWAQVKGRTEKDLLTLLPESIMIRLGALRPMHGENSKSYGGSLLLAVLAPLWPVLQWIWPNSVISTEELGRAMILAARKGSRKRVLESADLVALGRRGDAGVLA
jgi:nucleoside-diphosphate-sugar epimerase